MPKKTVLCIIIILVVISCGVNVLGADDTYVFTTASKGFSTVGNWNTGTLIGYDDMDILTANADDEVCAAWDIKVKSGMYKLYVWNCLSDKGSEEVILNISCTTANENKVINSARGVTGWKEIGTYNITDGMAYVGVSAKNGLLMANALKLEKVGIQ